MLMQRFGYANCKASILVISILFVQNIYLLPKKISMLIKTITLRDNEIMIKTRLL